MLSITFVLLLIALILFLLSAFGVNSPVNLQSAGLACLVLSMMIGATA